MNIRSVTAFCEPDHVDHTQLSQFFQDARAAFDISVQSCRVATHPFPEWWSGSNLVEQAQTFAKTWQEIGADYISLGPVKLQHDADWLELIPAILSATDVLFATAEIADTNGRLSTTRCQRAADIIRRISRIQDDGFGNLYFTALANCPPGSPFFPVAYHAGGPAKFAIAVESADIALTAIQQSKTLDEARENLVHAIEEAAGKIAETAVSLSQTHAIPFSGIDFSLAPFPTDDRSLGGALEA